jgi:hypothetical protein
MIGTCYHCGLKGESFQEQIFDHIFEALICARCDRFSALTRYGDWVESEADVAQYRREHGYYWRSVKGENHDKKEMLPLPRDGA